MTPQVALVIPGIWQIRVAWMRVYVLSDGTEFSLVDTGTCRDRSALLAGIAHLNLKLENCRQVILTHAHTDHAGNAAYLARSSGAEVIAHDLELPYLSEAKTYAYSGLRCFAPRNVMFRLGDIFLPVAQCSVNQVVRHGDDVVTPAGTWRAIHTPGHSPGHLSFFRQEDGALLAGDAILNIVPFRHIERLTLPLPLFNSDTSKVRKSAVALVDLQPRVFMSAHGPPLTEDVAAKLRELMQRCR